MKKKIEEKIEEVKKNLPKIHKEYLEADSTIDFDDYVKYDPEITEEIFQKIYPDIQAIEANYKYGKYLEKKETNAKFYEKIIELKTLSKKLGLNVSIIIK